MMMMMMILRIHVLANLCIGKRLPLCGILLDRRSLIFLMQYTLCHTHDGNISEGEANSSYYSVRRY